MSCGLPRRGTKAPGGLGSSTQARHGIVATAVSGRWRWQVVLRRLRWAASQLGVRPSPHLLEPGRFLVDLADLPPGWRILDQRRWRTGQQRDQPWAARARVLGSVTAWRSFANPAHDRWLWAQASPLASVEDAGHALPAVWEHRLANLRAQVRVVATEDGPPLAVHAEQVLTRQERTLGQPATAPHATWPGATKGW
jgi:hypothetical protein